MDFLISDGYRMLNAKLHQSRPDYGRRGSRHRDPVVVLLKECGADSTVLDYGCGKGTLRESLPGVRVTNYDPAFLGHRPQDLLPHDIVVCTDVLEHVEPEHLDAVLNHLRYLTRRAAYLVIATKPDGGKKLADGRDPHLTVQPAGWWLGQIRRFMQAELIETSKRDCTILASPR